MPVAEVQDRLAGVAAGHLAAIRLDVETAVVERRVRVACDGLVAERDGHQPVGADRVRAQPVVQDAGHRAAGALESRDAVVERTVGRADGSFGDVELRVEAELGDFRGVVERHVPVGVRLHIQPLRRVLQTVLDRTAGDASDESTGGLAMIDGGARIRLIPRLAAYGCLGGAPLFGGLLGLHAQPGLCDLCGLCGLPSHGVGRGRGYAHADGHHSREHQRSQPCDHACRPSHSSNRNAVDQQDGVMPLKKESIRTVHPSLHGARPSEPPILMPRIVDPIAVSLCGITMDGSRKLTEIAFPSKTQ
ncbi:hypothetical protein [Bifidobacterium erythrocebi]|uniref:hypothetical protein n=1 Tax=Bifidobacterium erythrocebi TaxID=2675325 RepID=UPI00145D59C0